MRKSTKIAIAVIVIAGLVGSGVYAGYYYSNASNPCPATTSSTTSEAIAGLGSARSTPGDGSLSRPPTLAAPVSNSSATGGGPAAPSGPAAAEVIPVVAAENFWGSLVAQIGGAHVNVTSIITDPNTDPHEYQSNDSDAIAIKNAQYVILNNVGYDTWATQLIAADGDTNQTVLNIGNMLGVYVTGGIVTGNPHLWYNPTYVNRTVAWMYHNLTTIAPALTGYFTEQYDNLTASLTALYDHVGQIRAEFAGTEVASTESIFVYLANATGLDLVSPPAFMEAVAEGNDPPDSSVVTFQCQLESGQVKVLVFNAQTVTPLTTSMKEIAQAHNVSVISVTETIVPPNVSFEAWMQGELNSLYVALDAAQLGE